MHGLVRPEIGLIRPQSSNLTHIPMQLRSPKMMNLCAGKNYSPFSASNRGYGDEQKACGSVLSASTASTTHGPGHKQETLQRCPFGWPGVHVLLKRA
jgi:hypothetical protein